MILDTSVIMAILHKEPESAVFSARIADAYPVAISAATMVELTMVTEGRGGDGARVEVDLLLAQAQVEVIPFTAEHAALAADGWRRYGKGRHPAGLNLGDCFAYALAQSRNEPLLFKGADFSLTDVKAAI